MPLRKFQPFVRMDNPDKKWADIEPAYYEVIAKATNGSLPVTAFDDFVKKARSRWAAANS